jgi:NitT/TauT family transport system ATP-binding protein
MEHAEGLFEPGPILSVEGLSMTFPSADGGLDTLDDISFQVYPRDFVCILGPSGSGKTTLLRLLAGLLQPTSGRVLLGGQVVERPPQGVGFVFQNANLMPWRTVLENITLPLEIGGTPAHTYPLQAREMVELVGLEGFEHSLPRDLSGGMAQRVAIARALVHDPQVLLLDEPFGSLDALTRERMRTELLRIWNVRQKTVVMVTHSINEALFLADRVLVFSQRPARLCLDMGVDFPRPREQEIVHTPHFGDLARQVREAIGLQRQGEPAAVLW